MRKDLEQARPIIPAYARIGHADVAADAMMKGKKPARAKAVDQRWTTQDELKFIDGIGRSNLPYNSPRARSPRLAMLRGYVASLEKRHRWGIMDKLLVISAAHQALKEEEGR